jgi:hypothetical protein
MCPDWPVLFINRALCQKQKGDWEAVERDSRRALELQPRLMKVLASVSVLQVVKADTAFDPTKSL